MSEFSEHYLERAMHIEEAARQQALAAVRRADAQQGQQRFDGQHCIDCDEPIPAARLALGRRRCVPCQQTMERRHANKT